MCTFVLLNKIEREKTVSYASVCKYYELHIVGKLNEKYMLLPPILTRSGNGVTKKDFMISISNISL